MRTLGIVLLVLLTIFFGGCAITAGIFTPMESGLSLVALVAGALAVACVIGIRLLSSNRTSRAVPPPPEQDLDSDLRK